MQKFLNKINLQKGAMFGLDARIALAIFGALSVISGAALYSAIQAAKAEQWNQVFRSISVASEAYLLDTGSYLKNVNAEGGLYSSDLLDTTREALPGWSGPYLNAKRKQDTSFTNTLTKPYMNADMYLVLQKVSDWTADGSVYDDKCNNLDIDCSQWVALSMNSSANSGVALDIFNKLDKKIDGSDGALTGKIRYRSNILNGSVYYKGIPAKRL